MVDILMRVGSHKSGQTCPDKNMPLPLSIYLSDYLMPYSSASIFFYFYYCLQHFPVEQALPTLSLFWICSDSMVLGEG